MTSTSSSFAIIAVSVSLEDRGADFVPIGSHSHALVSSTQLAVHESAPPAKPSLSHVAPPRSLPSHGSEKERSTIGMPSHACGLPGGQSRSLVLHVSILPLPHLHTSPAG